MTADAFVDDFGHVKLGGIAEVVADPSGAEALRTAAAELLRRTYTWDAIATSTVDVYLRACARGA